jgi:ATP-binding cassette, subfamily B, bacterial PglK
LLRLKLLFIAILAMAFLEVVGIASILPFMQLASAPDAVTENTWLLMVYETAGFETPRAMLISAGIAVLILIAVANAFTVFTTWLQHKFAWDVLHQLSTRMLRTYLNRPYDYFLTRNTSELFSNLIIESGQFTGGVLVPFLELVARALVVLVIFALLLVVDPLIALIVSGSLSVAYGVIYLARRRFLTQLGKERVEANLHRFKSMNEALAGIKTSRVYGAQDFFFNRFEKASANHSRIQPRLHLVVISPKYMIEILAFGGIILITLFLLIRNQNLQAALPLLSLYALAGYRLLPALQKAFSAAAILRHSLPVVDKIYEDLHQAVPLSPNPDDAESAVSPFSHSLILDGVTFRYHGADQPVLSNLNVNIPRGQTIAFVGATGSGKTTLVDIMVGLLHPQEGSVRIDHTALFPSNAHTWQQQLGYVPQEVFLFDDTVARNIAIGQEDDKIDQDRLEKAARLANIHSFIATELPAGYHTPIGERGIRLSGGQRQRLGLARALYRKPAVLILDEATSALDNITENVVIESLKTEAGDLTVIIIAHRLSTVRHADRIYLLEGGRIVAEGSYHTLLETSAVFREMAQLS